MASQEKQIMPKRSPTRTDPTNQALALLEEIIANLESKPYDTRNLLPQLRKYFRAVSLAGWDDGWIKKELNGYDDDDGVPKYRVPTCHADRIDASKGTKVDGVVTRFCLRRRVSDLLTHNNEGFKENDFERQKIKTLGPNDYYPTEYTVYKVFTVTPDVCTQVLVGISDSLYQEAVKHWISNKFGQIAESVFHEYQAAVDSAIANLGLGGHLKSAYENLLRRDKVSWQTAAMACRNIIHELSNKLWQVEDEYYPYLPGENGKPPLRVTRERYAARVRAYLHQNGLKRGHMLMDMLDPLYSMGSAGKESITYEHAQSVLIHTYIFLGETVRHTGMKPLEKVSTV
jgi:hypothetical protein